MFYCIVYCVLYYGNILLCKRNYINPFENHIKTKILLEVHNSDIDIEGQIRSIISANPESDILISDKSENDEIGMILHKMSADNSCIILDNVKNSQK